MSAIDEYLEEHAGDPLVKRSILLAQGKGSTEDKHDHLQDLIQMVKGIAQPLPYDKEKREEPIEETV